MEIETWATIATTDFSEFLIEWMTKFEQAGEYCFHKTLPKTAFLRMIFSLINDNTFKEIISFLLWVLSLHKQYFHHQLKIIFLLKTTQPLPFRLSLIAFYFFATCICKPMQQNSAVPLKPCHLMTSHQERILLVVSTFRSLRQCDHKKVVKKILSLFNTILSFGTKPFLVILVSYGTLKQHGLLAHKMFISWSKRPYRLLVLQGLLHR